jgi:hypothetical protein
MRLRNATDDTDFVSELQALMALEDGGPWQRWLTPRSPTVASISTARPVTVTCPRCRNPFRTSQVLI